MLEKDKMITGILIGIFLPVVLYALFYLIMQVSGSYVSETLTEKLILLLIGINAFFMRHFMVKREQDQIGKGILLVTFLGAIVYVIYYYAGAIV
jgi:hypothetical protein